MNKIINNQIIIDIPHPLNSTDFILQPVNQHLLGLFSIVTVQALIAKRAKVSRILLTIRGFKFGQLCVAEFKLNITALRNFDGIVRGLGIIWKERAHLLFGLIIKLIGGKLHPVLILHRVVRLDAQQDMVHFTVFFFNVMTVVCNHQGNARFLRQADNGRVYQLLIPNPMVLKLQVKIALAKNTAVFQRRLSGGVIIVAHQSTGDLSRQAGGKSNQALMVPLQKLKIYTRLTVKAFCPGLRDHSNQVLITGFIFAQQHQMAALCIQFMNFVEPGALSHINLTANNGFYPPFLRCLVKIHRTIHDTVVRDCYRLVPSCRSRIQQTVDSAGAIQQAIFCM